MSNPYIRDPNAPTRQGTMRKRRQTINKTEKIDADLFKDEMNDLDEEIPQFQIMGEEDMRDDHFSST